MGGDLTCSSPGLGKGAEFVATMLLQEPDWSGAEADEAESEASSAAGARGAVRSGRSTGNNTNNNPGGGGGGDSFPSWHLPSWTQAGGNRSGGNKARRNDAGSNSSGGGGPARDSIVTLGSVLGNFLATGGGGSSAPDSAGGGDRATGQRLTPGTSSSAGSGPAALAGGPLPVDAARRYVLPPNFDSLVEVPGGRHSAVALPTTQRVVVPPTLSTPVGSSPWPREQQAGRYDGSAMPNPYAAPADSFLYNNQSPAGAGDAGSRGPARSGSLTGSFLPEDAEVSGEGAYDDAFAAAAARLQASPEEGAHGVPSSDAWTDANRAQQQQLGAAQAQAWPSLQKAEAKAAGRAPLFSLRRAGIPGMSFRGLQKHLSAGRRPSEQGRRSSKNESDPESGPPLAGGAEERRSRGQDSRHTDNEGVAAAAAAASASTRRPLRAVAAEDDDLCARVLKMTLKLASVRPGMPTFFQHRLNRLPVISV